MKRTLAALIFLSACAETKPVVQLSGPAAASTTLSDDQVHQIVSGFEAQQAATDSADPLRSPKSFDDALEILKRDQVDLFAAGAQWAEAQQDIKAKALAAQIQLSWGEAQSLIAELLNSRLVPLRQAQSRLEAKAASGDLSAAERQRLDVLRDRVAKKSQLAEALGRAAQEHVAKGAVLAKAVIDASPNDYVGYRVAADYYRLRQDWANFDAMVAKIEQTNPNSNGLLFARGMAAEERDHNANAAAKMLKAALERDAKFTRAQAELVLIQGDPDDAFAEYQKLKELSPHHQIVVWAGDVIEQAHDEVEQERQERQLEKDDKSNRAMAK